MAQRDSRYAFADSNCPTNEMTEHCLTCVCREIRTLSRPSTEDELTMAKKKTSAKKKSSTRRKKVARNRRRKSMPAAKVKTEYDPDKIGLVAAIAGQMVDAPAGASKKAS